MEDTTPSESSEEDYPPDLKEYFRSLFIELETTKDQLSYKLKLNEYVWNKFFKSANDDDPMPFVVGLVGDTRTGKSSILESIKHKMKEDEFKNFICGSGREKKNMSLGGTSANIHLHVSDNFTKKKNKVYILDMEGSSANDIPLLLQKAVKQQIENGAQSARNDSLTYLLEDPIKRNKAVSKLLPTFAYIVCDLIILVSTDAFHNSRFLKNSIKFVKRIKVERKGGGPVLLLVSNRQTLGEGVWDIQECTKLFIETYAEVEDKKKKIGEILEQWYEKVNCICLPNWNEGSPNSSEPLGFKKYVKQIFKLNSYLEWVLERTIKKREKGFMISEKTFLELVRLIVDNIPPSAEMKLNSMIRMLDFYFQIMENMTGNVKRVNLIFSEILSRINTHENDLKDVKEKFQQICEFSMFLLASHLGLNLREKLACPIKDVQKTVGKVEAEQLAELILKRKLCSALKEYTIQENQHTKKIFFRCTLFSTEHDEHHFSNGTLSDIPSDWTGVESLVFHLKKIFGINFFPKWVGKFEELGEITSKDLINWFEGYLEGILALKNEHQLRISTAEVVLQMINEKPFSVHEIQKVPTPNEKDFEFKQVRQYFCIVCLTDIPLKEIFCTDCKNCCKEILAKKEREKNLERKKNDNDIKPGGDHRTSRFRRASQRIPRHDCTIS